jgi:hypothetical protein
MKKLFVLMTLLVLVLTLPLSVSADIIYTPRDDFFEEHQWECDYVDRSYTVHGPDGGLTVYKSPEDCLIQGKIPNGKKIYISHTYRSSDGIDWGYVDLWKEDITGWLPMPYVVPIYNGTDFWNEFEDRLEQESGIVPSFGDQEVRFWKYPGSESCSTRSVGDDPRFAPDYHYIFVDDAGQKWGKIGYYRGIRSSWVCLDNPTADYDTLYANHAPQQISQQETSPVTADDAITPSSISPTTILILAATVAAISIGLLVVLKKKKT